MPLRRLLNSLRVPYTFLHLLRTHANFFPMRSHRTHQLRVHCAAVGHPIVADQTYGYLGEGCEHGGHDELTMKKRYPHRASVKSQQRIDTLVRQVQENLCLHAKQLCLPHPISGVSITFEAPTSF